MAEKGVTEVLESGNRGFTQEYGIEYEETFAYVARLTSVRNLLAVAAARHWSLYQMDAKYISNLLTRAGLTDCKTTTTPVDPQTRLTPLEGHLLSNATLYCQLIGNLVYLSITCPDIAYVVHILHAFSDADWAGDPTDRRSTIGFCFFLGDSLIAWRSKKQTLVACSSTEAEYHALVDTTQELTYTNDNETNAIKTNNNNKITELLDGWKLSIMKPNALQGVAALIRI
ncbi:uncharacterized protein LOC114291706 [Camellia sinensis]|uniref:uncharacterized protein LOC114291706 n=1 Tax=Camellia sinensis TaxID=4442 RepID=UPI001035F745|nr:uncharacterized protein LOC114291706 [Camellia sinensis]